MKHLLTLTIILLLTACEGPVGPAGPQGPQGVAGAQGEKFALLAAPMRY